MYKLRIKAITVSQAKKLLKKRLKSFVVGEKFIVTFKFSNIGDEPFLGGKVSILIRWSVLPKWRHGIDLPIIESKGERTLSITSDVVSEGIGYIFFKVTSNDGKEVEMFDEKGNKYLEETDGCFIASISSKTWEEIYTYWALVIAAISLAIIASEKIFQLMQYIIQYLQNIPAVH